MGSFPIRLATDLRDRLGIVRAVETGTYTGANARDLSEAFEQVVTIELSPEYYERAGELLGDRPNVTRLLGDSAEQLATLPSAGTPTLYWLDAHHSGGDTAGGDDPAPILREIEALGAEPADDVLLIDDARDFASPPSPGLPTLVDVLDAVRRRRPGHYTTVVHDLIVAVPQRGRDIVDAFGREHVWTVWEAAEKARGTTPPKPTLTDRVYPLRAWVGRRLGRG